MGKAEDLGKKLAEAAARKASKKRKAPRTAEAEVKTRAQKMRMWPEDLPETQPEVATQAPSPREKSPATFAAAPPSASTDSPKTPREWARDMTSSAQASQLQGTGALSLLDIVLDSAAEAMRAAYAAQERTKLLVQSSAELEVARNKLTTAEKLVTSAEEGRADAEKKKAEAERKLSAAVEGRRKDAASYKQRIREAVADYKSSASFQRDIDEAISRRRKKIVKDFLKSEEGKDKMLLMHTSAFEAGKFMKEQEIYGRLKDTIKDFKPEDHGLPPPMEDVSEDEEELSSDEEAEETTTAPTKSPPPAPPPQKEGSSSDVSPSKMWENMPMPEGPIINVEDLSAIPTFSDDDQETLEKLGKKKS